MRPELIPWLQLVPLLLLGAGLTWAQQAPAREGRAERAQREARALLAEAQRPTCSGGSRASRGAFYPQGRGPLPPTKLFERVRGAKQHPDRLYLSVGLYEPNLLPQNRALRALLAKLPGAPTPVFHEEPEGHAWTFWPRDLPRALRALWGKPTSTTPRGR